MKNKKSKKELTRLIMAALILGGGCLYGPVAEAEVKEAGVNNTELYGGATDTSAAGVNFIHSTTKTSTNTSVDMTFNVTNTASTYYSRFKDHILTGNFVSQFNENLDKYTVNLMSGKVKDVWGAYIFNQGYGNVSNNIVNVSGGIFTTGGGNVGGGYTIQGNASNNEVNITGGTGIVNVYGGYSTNGNANNNSVTLGGTTTEPIIIGGNVVGGRASVLAESYANSVTLEGTANISGSLYGGMLGGAATNGKNNAPNILYLAGNAQGNTVTTQNTVVNGFGKFVIKDDFTFKRDKTILSAYQFLNPYGITIDLTGATKLTSDKLSAGTMTLFSTTGSSGMGTLFVTGETGQLTTSGFEISTFTNDVHSLTNNVTLTHSGKHKIYIDDNTTTKNVYYKIENILSNVNLSGWNGSVTSAVPTGWTKGTSAVTVSGTISDAAKTAVGAGNSKDIVTADSALFSDSGIDAAIKYNPNVAFSENLTTGITISGNQGTGVKASTDGKKLTYNNAVKDKANMTGVTLGAMTWGQDTASTTDYSFKNTATIDATNLSFSATNALIAKDTKKTLLSASGLGGNTINGNTDKTFEIVNGTDSNGLKYNATAKGKVETETGKVNFKVNEVTLNTLNLSGWNGTGTSSLLSGWTKNTSGVSVVGVFTKPSLAPGASKTILTTDTPNFFSDATISEDIRYKTGDSFSDTVNGVTLAGNKAGGVMATNNYQDLIFYGEKNDVNSVSLGSMTWGTPREANAANAANAAYDFSGVTSIDASSLGFTGTATLNSLNDSTNLLTGATGLTADTILNGTNKIFDIKYTNATTGITYFGKATTGAVSRDGTTLKYTISGGELDTINLNTWDPTGGAGDIPAGWTPPSGGVAVDTGDFQTPGGDDPVDIFTTETEGFFKKENVTGDKKYKDHEKMPDDKKDGVTISGTQTGGIAPSNDGINPSDSGKRLTYFTEYTTGTGISLGEVAWNKGGTARTLSGRYDFSALGNNDVNATGLTFTFTDAVGKSVNTIAKDDTMTLLSGATGLNADLTVKGSPVSQGVSYSLGNGTGLSGTLTGDVTTTTGTVNYKVTGKTLDSVNLSNWDGTTNETLDTSWSKNASGINVTGSGFTAPTTIGDTPILTTNVAGYFSNAQIADNIKYQPSGSYTETDKNITLSGSRGSGVKADDTNGSKLVYSIGAAFINNIKLGTVDYTKGGTWLDKSDSNKYNFSNLSSLDTTGFFMSMDNNQKKSAAVGDTMTLVLGNNTLGNIAEKDAGASNYTYAPTTGMAVNGTVYGKVSASNNDVLYTVSDKKATTLNITNVTWDEGNAYYNRDNAELDYKDAVVDSSNIFFSGITSLNKDKIMTLISNYGSGINKTRSGIFTIDDGNGNLLKGKGVAYYDSGSNSLMYKVTLGAGEIQPAVSATNNKAILIIPDGQEHQGTVTGGEAKGDGDSTDNEQGVKGKIITNTDGTGGDVNGGTSEEGDSRRNKADVEDSTIEGDVNGGKSENGNSTDNEAEVDHSNVGGDVNGGKTDGDGETKGNEANVKNGSKVTGSVTGGHSGGNGDCTGNAAEVEGSEVGGDVNGGQSDGNGNTRENKTHVKDSKVTGNVTGGHSGQNDGSGGNGESTGNTAEVEGSEVGGNVNGGRSEQGNANKNESTVSGGSKVTGDVTGGSSGGGGTANENKTTVEGGSHIGGNVTGGESNGGNTNKNETTVSGSTVDKDVIGGKTSGNGTSNENKTNVNGSKVGGNVIGGQSENGNAEKNETTVSGGSTVGGDVIGGKTTGTGNANENKVTLDGGSTVNGNIYGGYSQNGDASGNDVNIGTSKINGDIYGGFGSGNTTNNTITLSSGADVSNSNIFGGSNGSAGNTLNIGTSTEAWSGGGQSVKNISNFETLNFSSVPWNNSNAALNISDGSASDLSMTTIQAPQVAFSGVKRLSSGSTMMFLNQSNVTPATNKATNLVAGSAFTLGTAMEGSGRLTLDADGNVIYLIENASVSEQTHNTVMAAEAAVLSINSGNDFITSATEGLAQKENVGTDGLATYAKIGGQSMKQDTGSHVKVNTWNAILALGHKNTKKQSAFEYGAFVEHGWGNFATHNNGLRGDGSAEYTGGGLLAKWKTNNGTYVEGSFRAGTVNEKANNLLRDAVQAYGYDERTSYAGFHIGVGKETVLKNGNLVDVYGKYFYNRKNGMNFNAGFDEYNIDAVTSQILRVGARYTVKSGSRWNYYGDLSYEHEFDGKATGRVNDMAIRGADISGGSLRMELGASLTPNDESPWEVDFNLTAYAGNKSGFTGGVSVKYAF